MGIRIVHEAEPYRMIADALGRCAVIEARNGRVYSLDCPDRREADDTPEGMALVAAGAWRSHEQAAERFLFMARGEKHYAETLW
ncbi:hypothetical protein [Arenibaculum pallidiluteum]|uniref:hypothetical protein n=1 Tax=Arenibaculum pallidiluteum TaxID=2812559 RepID=UPI001A96CC3F|nr:hypothetical protein [Arenibaculum pallidiluteum]